MTGLLKQVKRTINNWWLFVILGALLIICGIWVMKTPVESYITLSIFFSVMVLVNGIFDIIFSISNHKILKGWGWHMAGGILKILMGIVLMNYPGITMIVLPLIVGFWLMYGAVSIISGAFDLKSYHLKGWGWVLALGVLLMIFSFMVIADTIFGAKTIVIFTSLAIITYGVSYIMVGLKLKKVKDFGDNIKEVVISKFDDLKTQVLASIEDAKENQPTSEEIRKKFDSFKDSIS